MESNQCTQCFFLQPFGCKIAREMQLHPVDPLRLEEFCPDVRCQSKSSSHDAFDNIFLDEVFCQQKMKFQFLFFFVSKIRKWFSFSLRRFWRKFIKILECYGPFRGLKCRSQHTKSDIPLLSKNFVWFYIINSDKISKNNAL